MFAARGEEVEDASLKKIKKRGNLKNPVRKLDTLIIGAGLAGCLLAWRLRAAGQGVQVFGDAAQSCATSVAAGVINPVTGRWAVKSWQIDALLPEAEQCYRTIEAELGIEIYHPIPLRRFCQNEDDLKRIGRRSRNPRYANVLGKLSPQGNAPSTLCDPCGSFEIFGAAYVDLPQLMKAMRAELQTHHSYQEARFEHRLLEQDSNNLWRYGDFAAERVLFCEGAAVVHNPFFPNLPMKPVKGETLAFRCPELPLPRSIYHNGKWLLPYGENRFRIGATYDEEDLSPSPTPEAKSSLLEALAKILKEVPELEIEQQLAGLRPSTIDARPILGQHPEKPGLYLLNGLGSKGASLAPLMTRQFVEHLLQDHPLDPEIDLARFQ
ncbi:MAG: Glycine oxidase [Opitutia bacterium UBA7350]|nr:MAG: Glycine oxidase [Opitutae bacterium UBA7350]